MQFESNCNGLGTMREIWPDDIMAAFKPIGVQRGESSRLRFRSHLMGVDPNEITRGLAHDLRVDFIINMVTDFNEWTYRGYAMQVLGLMKGFDVRTYGNCITCNPARTTIGYFYYGTSTTQLWPALCRATQALPPDSTTVYRRIPIVAATLNA